MPDSSSTARPATSTPPPRSGAARWECRSPSATPKAKAQYAELSNTPADLNIEVQKVGHPSRVHLDIETDDLDAEAARLEALGAKRIAFIKRWWVMQAPTGQRFCIVRMKHPERGAPPNVWP